MKHRKTPSFCVLTRTTILYIVSMNLARTEKNLTTLLFQTIKKVFVLARSLVEVTAFLKWTGLLGHPVQFDEQSEQPIIGWYCTCSAGGREVGMCSHVTALLWQMGVERAMLPTSIHPLSVSRLLTAIDTSMQFSDEESNSENDEDDKVRIWTTRTNNIDDEELNW